MNSPRGELAILACESGKPFAQKIAKEISKISQRKITLIQSDEIHFANTEVKSVVQESIRGRDVFVIQDVENSTNGNSIDENIRALYTMMGACHRCDASYVTAVLPAFPYARQDKNFGREDITASRVAWEIETYMGAKHVLTLDIHNKAIMGFFREARIDNLQGSHIFVPYLKKKINRENTVILPTDLGGAKRANYYAQQLGTDIAFTYKRRNYSKPNSVEEINILGNIKGKEVIIVDDMICTGGTFCQVVELANKLGAKKITGLCSLPLFNGDSIKKINRLYKKGYIKKIISTDAVYHGKNFAKETPWFEEVSMSEYFAEIIHRINHRKSIGELLD